MQIKFIVATLLLLFVPVSLYAAPALQSTNQTKSQEPIQIEADHMLSTQKDNSVFFSGRVVAKQGILTIHSDELTVYYASSQGQTGDKQVVASQTKEIERMFAKGNVKITQKDWVATGDTAEYFDAQRKVVIIGNAKVWQDNNMVTGDRFVLFLDEGKSIVEHGKKNGERVKAFFYPKHTK